MVCVRTFLVCIVALFSVGSHKVFLNLNDSISNKFYKVLCVHYAIMHMAKWFLEKWQWVRENSHSL